MEHRGFPRIAAAHLAVVTHAATVYAARTIDLSLTGVALELYAAAPPRPGASVTLALSMHGCVVNVLGEVARAIPLGDGAHDVAVRLVIAGRPYRVSLAETFAGPLV